MLATNSNLKQGVGQAKQSAGWLWRVCPPAVVKCGRAVFWMLRDVHYNVQALGPELILESLYQVL